MALASGTKLGPYETLSPLGAGGMGEVYRARDPRLEREVAIKVLPAKLSADANLRQRLEREAKAVSKLSHPHICTLHDIGHQDGVDFLVMELLEGETLEQRLARGQLPLEQLLKIGAEVCDGLEKAHRSGVVPRDLKPSNIMLTKSGAKLMDFGLAKPAAAAVGASSSSHSLATMSQPLTAEGTIVGTFQYISPEQVEGKEADARSDIFSFGAILYEMVTGKRAFEGKTTASTIAAILAAEPKPISAIHPMSPPAFEHIVKTCIAKDPDVRWQSAHDVKLQLQWLAQTTSQAGLLQPTLKEANIWNRLAWLLVGLLLVAGGASTAWWIGARQPRPTMYFASLFPAPANDVALSPDGRVAALVAYSDQVNKYVIWTYEVGGRGAVVLPGTEGATHPFWSPDGKSIAFFSQGKLKKIDFAPGSSAQVLCDAPHGRGGTWNRDNVIVFAPDVWTGLQRVSSGGGTPVQITQPDPARQEMSHRWPLFLPDGRHFLYLAANFSGEFRKNTIYVGSLDSNEKHLVTGALSNAAYAEPGYLLYLRETTLMAQKFDLRTYSLRDEPHTLSSEVQYSPQIDLALFSVAGKSTLAVQPGKGVAKSQLMWLDRNGKQVGVVGTLGVFADPAISPDGRHVAFSQMDPDGRTEDIWIRELGNDALVRITFGPGLNELPVWTPDGKRITFMSNQKLSSAVHVKNADGSGSELQIAEPFTTQQEAWSWSPDGRFLLVSKNDALTYSLSGDREPKTFIQGNWIIRNAQFSPDGKWVAYSSNETGDWEIYVSPFPAGSSKWQVSRGGGAEPRWRRDGKELFYLSPQGIMMAVTVKTGDRFEAGSPVALFQARVRQEISSGDVVSYDVSADGQRFLVNTKVNDPNAAPLSIILNWASEMER